MNQLTSSIYNTFLSNETRKKSERIILIIAIASFFVHLSLIFLADLGAIKIDSGTTLFENPIAAIYTPFSFILVYEVYLLIFYLPRSITTYIGKQYEIITLIIIRRIFKDLSANQNLSFLIVTHDDDFAKRTDRIIQMGDGKIIWSKWNTRNLNPPHPCNRG